MGEDQAGGRRIRLTQEYWAMVDAADYDLLMQWKWCYANGYAVRGIRGRKHRTVYMHKFLLDPRPGCDVDHRDCNGLNNRRSNLHVVSHADNMRNRGPFKNNKSGYRGVRVLVNGRWNAAISHQGKTIHIGNFATAEEAARAWDERALLLRGANTRLNFPRGGREAAPR